MHPSVLCNESSRIREGPARNWPHPWRYGCLAISDALESFLENSADFFRQLSVRRHFKWLLSWFSTTAHTSIWLSGCPLGVLALRLFTVLISNDADRCIQMRDARMGLDLMHVPLADVVESGWPVFRILAHLAEESRRISYPLENACDELDSLSARAFRDRVLRPSLHEHRAVPVSEAWIYLKEPPPRCAIGVATAYFTLAAQHSKAEPEKRALLERGQEMLLEWPSLQRSLYALLTTRWPFWRALDRNMRPPAQLTEGKEEDQTVEVDVVFCGRGVADLGRQLRSWCATKSWHLHFLQADLAACPGFFQDIGIRENAKVLMLSPLLWSTEGLDTALHAKNFSLLEAGADVLGFPTLDSNFHWNFAVHRLRLENWTLRYEAFPTGKVR
ncbi:unnamed protein product [Durusdinium trenchii]|uniref:Uncharacterized protein n=1 Tax=Durusdinium trenchii TaxID=1381693 RepID=A0ABP0PH19_9DINO